TRSDGRPSLRAWYDLLPSSISRFNCTDSFRHDSARRGSPFTFNSPRLLQLVQALAAPISDAPIKAPSFDHSLKDPVEDDITILPTHRIVIMEGNYLSFSPLPLSITPTTASNVTYTASEPWKNIAETFNERYF